eukprot:CAMPEP_0202910368 /NCGR_PEP_ID=MMETSP1392-20130828/51864_1 /ASSEMBLY_ACC=CAM_ASM_000868 /TAXON_ID=225041 /ORGANISM="Chlamydomonas chlamydogama, Strain SAG 11-48b" /LENGTH=91 /DNA_ID=CAMNT_0049600463 /DNA_START=695 /DNA_END=966 /DNA_ORIENTATION=-
MAVQAIHVVPGTWYMMHANEPYKKEAGPCDWPGAAEHCMPPAHVVLPATMSVFITGFTWGYLQLVGVYALLDPCKLMCMFVVSASLAGFFL